VIVDVDGFHRPRLHIDIPYLKREIVPRKDKPTVMTELDIRYGRDDFGEEGPVRRVFLFLIF
jgi:hypothetical protein